MSSWIALAALALALPVAARAAEPGNQCVNCHAAEPMPIWLGHSFEEWRTSTHAQHDIGCEKCHGGDPTASDAALAHRGVQPASDPASRIHATHLAATCGSCHAEQLAAFQKTSHAKQLKEKGQGATCMTCHDAMATSLPSPATLEARCATCHAKRLEAKNALAMLAATKRRLRTTQGALEAARTADPAWAGGALQRLHDLQGTYHSIQLEWHAFDTPRLFANTRDVLELATLLEREVAKHGALKARETGDEGKKSAAP